MSLQIAAQHMASRGRGPDTTLVHMAPQEVAGLQALAKAHGGSLTTNPDTGLPEAGFLSSILPTLIGVGLSVASGGTLTPLMAAGITGAGYGVATGSLSKGLMAGLGAYGGAGLAGGLMGAGTGAISAGAGADVAAAANNISGVAPGVESVAQVGSPIAESANLSQTGTNLFGSSTPSPYYGAGQGAEAMTIGNPVSPVNAAAAVPTTTVAPAPMSDPSIVSEATQERLLGDRLAKTTSLDTAKAGLSEIGKNPSRFMTMDNAKYAMAGLAPMLLGGQEQDEYKGSGPNPYEYSYDYKTGSYTRQAPGYRNVQTVTPPRAMADGGPVQAMSDRNEAQTLMANNGQMFAGGGGISALARGGQSHLGDYSDGGRLLRGPGDGVSDSIPASIGNKRPARLADGEFVVPARIVSELGNGSTEAGARKLYAMMDRVQKARKKSIGKDRVAVNSRAEKLLPA